MRSKNPKIFLEDTESKTLKKFLDDYEKQDAIINLKNKLPNFWKNFRISQRKKNLTLQIFLLITF